MKKKLAITKEPCLAFSVNHVILGTTQFVSTLIQVFSLCWKGLHVLTVAYQIFCHFFDSVILDSNITMTSREESPCSTPLPTPLLSSSPSKNMQPIQSHATNLRIVAINFWSVCAKKEEFWCPIDAAKPDVIIGSETWIKPDISDCEIFPPGYHVYRKDRADGYGGVLLGISTCLNSNKIETEGEFVAAKVLSSKHAIILLPPITHIGVTKPTWTLSTKLCLLYATSFQTCQFGLAVA